MPDGQARRASIPGSRISSSAVGAAVSCPGPGRHPRPVLPRSALRLANIAIKSRAMGGPDDLADLQRFRWDNDLRTGRSDPCNCSGAGSLPFRNQASLLHFVLHRRGEQPARTGNKLGLTSGRWTPIVHPTRIPGH